MRAEIDQLALELKAKLETLNKRGQAAPAPAVEDWDEEPRRPAPHVERDEIGLRGDG